ncbi:MAG: oppA-G [Parachlamydiales bacterium]|nr:oppA-G [Parachlamydiales bacterium]
MTGRLWVLLLLVLAISCRSTSSSKTSQVLRINIQCEPVSLDPRKARDLNAVTMMHMLFEGLARIGKDGRAQLAMAESVAVSEDGLRYSFRLREASWSNKEKITSADFAESWRKILDPAFPTDLAYQLYVIKGAKKAKTGEISPQEVEIQTPDSRTLIVELEQPTPYFLELLTFPSFFPVYQPLDAQNPHWAEDPATYVSNGPFKLTKWKHSDRVFVERNGSYWDAGSVSLKGIEMVMIQPETELRMFLDGDLDWAGSPLSNLPIDALNNLKRNETLRVQPLSGTYILRVNTADSSLLSQPLFRRALALALNRQKIAEHILQGGQIPAQALVPPMMGLAPSGYFADASFSEAQTLLSTVLKQNGQETSDIGPITLLYVAQERNHLIAQTVQKQIEAVLGMNIQLEAVERKMFFERLSKKKYQLAAGSWIADFGDPINFLEVFKYKDGSSNNTGWEMPKYIERLNSSAVCRDEEERKSILREAEQLLMDQMPVIPIFHFSLNYLQQEEVKDVCLSPIGQIDFRWSHIEEPTR